MTEPVAAADLAELERLAQAAPQQGPFGRSGPWTGGSAYSPSWIVEPTFGGGTVAVVTVFGGGEEQAAFFAAASPSVVLDLIARLRRAQKIEAALREVVEGTPPNLRLNFGPYARARAALSGDAQPPREPPTGG